MSESTERGKPTPGPWSYRSTGEILTADGEIIGRISYGKIGWIGGGDAHANGDLISTAPEMLDALESLIELPAPPTPGALEIHAAARAAIRKARGL